MLPTPSLLHHSSSTHSLTDGFFWWDGLDSGPRIQAITTMAVHSKRENKDVVCHVITVNAEGNLETVIWMLKY